jgi:hypothetical protein
LGGPAGARRPNAIGGRRISQAHSSQADAAWSYLPCSRSPRS